MSVRIYRSTFKIEFFKNMNKISQLKNEGLKS